MIIEDYKQESKRIKDYFPNSYDSYVNLMETFVQDCYISGEKYWGSYTKEKSKILFELGVMFANYRLEINELK